MILNLTDTGENVQKWTGVFSTLTRRSEASEKREENNVSFFGHFRMWTSFESTPVSVNITLNIILKVMSHMFSLLFS